MHHDYVEDDVPRRIDPKSVLPKVKAQKLKAITDIDGVRALYEMIVGYSGDFSTTSALRFQALSALRPGNIRNMRWEYVDMRRSVVSFPSEAMKSKMPFRLPITASMAEIIEAMRPETMQKSAYVFCSPIAPSKQMSENTLNYAHKRMGITEHNAHGWRSSFSTICYERQKEHGFGAEVIESQLSHSIGSNVKTAYLRSDFLEERRELLGWWERMIASRTAHLTV